MKPSRLSSALCLLVFPALLSVPAQSAQQSAQQPHHPSPEPLPVDAEGTQVATGQTQAAAANADELRKATQNPIASLISVPVQNNNNFGVSPGNRIQDVLNIQPVVPLSLSTNLNLVIRWITPIVWQPLSSPPGTPETGVYGFGDMQPTFFLVPKKTGKLIYGAGPILQLPTATSTYTGQGKLGIGPSIVLLTQPGHWTIGVLANNVWSVAGSGSRPDVNQFLLQYFVNYNLQKGWYLTTSPILTANWNANPGDTWTVPFGGGAGRVMKLGFQPVNLSATFYANSNYPSGASTWNMRLQIAFLFPKLTREQQAKLMEQKLQQLRGQAAPKKQ